MEKANGSKPVPRPDAGMRSLEHYSERLPKWRRYIRDRLIPIVRWETPRLAKIQDRFRSPALDCYFTYTAILGTHTFFMIILPILNWFGYNHMFRAMCQMLAAGVVFSGFVKDTVCLPRPLSPPLQRINRSSTAAFEYGFPSTHSTNAVSVIIYAFHAINTTGDVTIQALAPYLQIILLVYLASILLGRLYCGMHGFFDVGFGGFLGLVIAVAQCLFGELFDTWAIEGPIKNIVIVSLLTLVMVRVHPEPADDCPCFDDTLAFSGVFIGIQFGAWRFARSSLSWNEPMLATSPFTLAEIGYIRAVLRVLIGVLIIFVWRGIMKPTMLRVLPPIFRVVGSLGLLLPRKFFLSASQYNQVPTLRRDDNVIPPASDIPGMLTSLRHARKRTVSIGPQSEADVYEAMDFRHRRRRESMSGSGDYSAIPNSAALSPSKPDFPATSDGAPAMNGQASPVLPSPLASEKETRSFEHYPGQAADEAEDEKMFRRLLRPRVRYDVEVLTKLVVYTGIGWLAVEGNPVFFELSGLGVS